MGEPLASPAPGWGAIAGRLEHAPHASGAGRASHGPAARARPAPHAYPGGPHPGAQPASAAPAAAAHDDDESSEELPRWNRRGALPAGAGAGGAPAPHAGRRVVAAAGGGVAPAHGNGQATAAARSASLADWRAPGGGGAERGPGAGGRRPAPLAVDVDAEAAELAASPSRSPSPGGGGSDSELEVPPAPSYTLAHQGPPLPHAGGLGCLAAWLLGSLAARWGHALWHVSVIMHHVCVHMGCARCARSGAPRRPSCLLDLGRSRWSPWRPMPCRGARADLTS